jgi:hypothetical protein
MTTKTKTVANNNLFGTRITITTQTPTGISKNTEKTFWGDGHCNAAVAHLNETLKAVAKTKSIVTSHLYEPVTRETV